MDPIALGMRFSTSIFAVVCEFSSPAPYLHTESAIFQHVINGSLISYEITGANKPVLPPRPTAQFHKSSIC